MPATHTGGVGLCALELGHDLGGWLCPVTWEVRGDRATGSASTQRHFASTRSGPRPDRISSTQPETCPVWKRALSGLAVYTTMSIVPSSLGRGEGLHAAIGSVCDSTVRGANETYSTHSVCSDFWNLFWYLQ